MVGHVNEHGRTLLDVRDGAGFGFDLDAFYFFVAQLRPEAIHRRGEGLFTIRGGFRFLLRFGHVRYVVLLIIAFGSNWNRPCEADSDCASSSSVGCSCVGIAWSAADSRKIFLPVEVA